nr:synaptic glycoprotein sc2 [Hymenolepis microstoma]
MKIYFNNFWTNHKAIINNVQVTSLCIVLFAAMTSVTILHFASEKVLLTLKNVEPDTTVRVLKEKLASSDKKYKFDRISFRLEPRGIMLANTSRLNEIVGSEKLSCVCLYYKDLGPQVSWSTVFYLEYAGPLAIYSLVFAGIPLNILGSMKPHDKLHWIFFLCYTGHFAKRLLETRFVHRFSHATMPLMSFVRNCAYYWLFAFAIAYFTNHPLYTTAYFGCPQICTGLGLFLVGEIGNFCCHIALRNLRPVGSTVRKMPRPVASNLPTFLFDFVACPNYTYEVLSWIGFTIMTQTLPAALFTLFGFVTMAQWARKKLRAYRKEFESCPKGLKAIVPFIY